jgi:hypothetical protein
MKANIKYEIRNSKTAQTKSALAMKRLPPFHACL